MSPRSFCHPHFYIITGVLVKSSLWLYLVSVVTAQETWKGGYHISRGPLMKPGSVWRVGCESRHVWDPPSDAGERQRPPEGLGGGTQLFPSQSIARGAEELALCSSGEEEEEGRPVVTSPETPDRNVQKRGLRTINSPLPWERPQHDSQGRSPPPNQCA